MQEQPEAGAECQIAGENNPAGRQGSPHDPETASGIENILDGLDNLALDPSAARCV